ncbi:polynucleotide kinase-phosphatase [Nonomuraea soli]|uniref:Polynucleotide kinase-phosphatase n=1 Tax=Nonomuraea soli TaxID=1032476 RepID=A0A7W0HSX7_9ACTN|nr:polynucleotide kinase-phosphatase [Nonomuraea soli]MBA2894460.1 polynucleotide kinase-phosphatase [Nonomuraea soli]
MTEVRVPELSLVVLVGVSGSGKSTFAAKHFKPTQVISSDYCRGLVADDENDQAATPAAFDLLHHIVGIRLSRGLLTVVDATNVQYAARKSLIDLAKRHDVLVDAIVLDVPEEVAIARNESRPDRDFGAGVVIRQRKDLRRSLSKINRDGFRKVHVLHGLDEIESATIGHDLAWSNKKHLTGPFDIVGDIHGCRSELQTLLSALGWQPGREIDGRWEPGTEINGTWHPAAADALTGTPPATPASAAMPSADATAVAPTSADAPAAALTGTHPATSARATPPADATAVALTSAGAGSAGAGPAAPSADPRPEVHWVDARHPDGRTAVFVGDLVDRGPDTPGVLRLVMSMVEAGRAICVAGNHEQKLVRALNGRKVRVAHGLQESLDQLAAADESFVARARTFMDGLLSHYQLDGGNLVVAHAGLKEAYHGRASGRVRSFALYGDTTGETDEYGLPVRYPWAEEYRGRAMVVYGHTPTIEPTWINNTICLDTGAVFGGSLTALRYPEKQLVSVPAEQVWYESVKPLNAPGYRDPGTLDIGDVQGTRHIETRFLSRVKIPEENAASALEVMSRFAVDPRWLLYLPPTMAPPETSRLDGYLEHPHEAFEEFAAAGVTQVVCEEKHMGSRAIAVLARTPEAAAARFGITDGSTGSVYTRTGRPFFGDLAPLVDRLREACEPLWKTLDSDWVMLDCELLPWSAKAMELIRTQYASVGAASRTALPAALSALTAAAGRGLDVGELVDRTRRRDSNAALFRAAYARYCWPVDGLEGVRLAPFQILACEGRATALEPHAWHLSTLGTLDHPLIAQTRHLFVSLDSQESRDEATAWWETMTAAGGEGMVVKPAEHTPGRIQPGVKVRGREYLRIIYGPDYTESLDLLRRRFLGKKRSLALREHALGLEALSRLADGEALWRVHEPVFGVLALESEPVDPRL